MQVTPLGWLSVFRVRRKNQEPGRLLRDIWSHESLTTFYGKGILDSSCFIGRSYRGNLSELDQKELNTTRGCNK